MKLSIVPQDSKSTGTKLKLVSNLQKAPNLDFDKGFDSNEPTIMKLKLKPQYQGPTAADTKLYTPRTHVYMKPEMWMGANADIFIEEETWLFDTKTQKIYKKMINYVPGVERIFIEIAANGADNGNMSRRMGSSVGELEITMNNTLISIKSFGALPMPVEPHPDEPDKYLPEVSFGRLLTSRHYETERNESGTNGVGSKATNIFSKEFACIVFDNVRHKKYTQTWSNNMKICNPPILEDYYGKIASVEIIYKMDFTRFGYPEPNGTEGGYPEELIHLFCRHASDISFTAKMPVTFNGIKFNNSNLRDYGRLYFGDLVDTAVIHYQWPPGTEIIKKKKGYQVSKDPAILPIVELLALDTPDSKDHLSFANSLMTKNGGIHVNAAIKAVADSTVKMINEEMSAKIKGKGKKTKEADSKDKKIPTITINDVKPHISILLSVKVTNPKFDGQEKTKLLESKPPPKINISDESLKIVARWKLVDRLYLALEAKQMSSLKGNGKMQANVRTKKGTKANKAGGPESHKCTLYITEGDSGDLYVETLTTLLPGGSNYAGRLPMKGKSLNAMNASIFEILRNPEFNQLNKMLGLIPGADYMDDAYYNKLRYGALMIAADSDVDGKHITGLILLYFHRCFPALLHRGFILNYLTPIVGVRYKGYFYKFYTQIAYSNWMAATPDSSKISADDHKYYKGLASSEDHDIAADFQDPHIIHCFYDIDAPDALSLAFAKGREDERKEWLKNWKPLTDEPKFIQQPISWFINNELILHSWDNVLRTLPRLMDGLKEGHRKIIYAMHLQWAIGSKKKTYKEEKVAGFSGYVAGHTAYHHGEAILAKTIVGMAQDFIGSNNIPYLAKKGQFGTRSKLGRKAGQPRYIHTHPMPIVATIFDKKDAKILKHKEEEGKKIEPEQYLPKVPTVLINGSTGIGTGWSTYTPPHDPLDILKGLRILLHGGSPLDLPRLIPWFRNFLGTIEIINRKTKTKIVVKATEIEVVEIIDENKVDDKDDSSNTEESNSENLIDDLPEEFANEDKEDKDAIKQLYSMKITGNFEVLKNGNILITELPVGRAPFDYMKWLEKLVDEKKIKNFDDNCAKDIVSFTIYGYTGTPTHKNLLLEKVKGLSNMYLLDENNKPKKYRDANHILIEWFNLRLPFYQVRKDYMIKKIEDEIQTMKYKIIFYTEVAITKSIAVLGVRRATVHDAMDKLGVPHEIYKGGNLPHLSIEGIQELHEEVAAKEKEKEELEKISIQQMMLTDLDEFEKVYRREFKIKDKVIKLKVGKNNTTNTKTISKTPVLKFPANTGTSGKSGKQVNKPRSVKLNVI
jgi:DNA topoisomerase-2